MLRLTVGARIGLGFAVVLALLLGIGFMSYRGTSRLIETGDAVAHTHEVLAHINKLLVALDEAESSQRGFLLTGDEIYLQSHQGTVAEIERAARELRRLTADNPRQQERLDTLAPLI